MHCMNFMCSNALKMETNGDEGGKPPKKPYSPFYLPPANGWEYGTPMKQLWGLMRQRNQAIVANKIS